MNYSLSVLALLTAAALPACVTDASAPSSQPPPAAAERGLFPPPSIFPDCSVAQAVPCSERVWFDGIQYNMDFFDLAVTSAPSTRAFYVVAPQSTAPQGTFPFPHDHILELDDTTYWHGYFVVCTPSALASGACVATAGPGGLPLMSTVNGRHLRRADALATARAAGLLSFIDTGATMRAELEPEDPPAP